MNLKSDIAAGKIDTLSNALELLAGPVGLEPTADRLWVERSNQLSYESYTLYPDSHKNIFIFLFDDKVDTQILRGECRWENSVGWLL